MEIDQLKKSISLVDYVQKSGLKLEKAGQNAYRLNPCPVCGHSDHFTIYPGTNSYTSFSGCCRGGSIIDYMIEVEGMEKDTAIARLKELAGLSGLGHENRGGKQQTRLRTVGRPEQVTPIDKKGIENVIKGAHEGNPEQKETAQQEPAEKRDAEITSSEKKEIAHLVAEALKNSTEYYTNRGLRETTVSAYRLGYLPEGHSFGKTFKYVLPVTEKFVILRSDNEQDRYRNIGHTEILNLSYLEQESKGSKIFVTEGYFDALSLEDLGYKALALNSTAMSNRFIEKVSEHNDKLKDKQVILALDNDQGGRVTTRKLKIALSELGVPCAALDLAEYKDINQHLVEDRAGLKKKIEQLPLEGTVYEYLREDFELDQLKRLSEPEIKTGFESLDHTLGGGIYPGLYVLGAISSLGKTALALQIADRIAAQDRPVLFFSLEMGRFEMTCRSLARVVFEQGECRELTTGHILKTSYRGHDLFSRDFFKRALNTYREGPAKNLTVEEGNYALDITMLRQITGEQIGRTGLKPVVIVDYLQVLRPVDLRITEKQHIDMTIVELKRLSRDLDTPVIAVSSFNRANYKTDVTFEAFKESGAIEYTADVVLAMQLRKNGDEDINELKNREPRPLELVVLKNRRGRAFEVIDLDYWPKQNFFVEV